MERVVARLHAIETPLPKAKPEIRAAAERFTPRDRPGDYAQAMMDLGATLCSPKRPKCLTCPIAEFCKARALGLAEELPRRLAKAERPTRRAVAFWLVDGGGAVLLRRRPETGLLGGMMELPSTPWRAAPWAEAEARAAAPPAADWVALPGLVRHTFTHFHLEAHVWAGRADSAPAPDGGRWVALDRLGDEALPSVMRKLVRHAMAQSAALWIRRSSNERGPSGRVP